MKIGVFDSGIGGLSVANAIKKAMPDYEIIFVNDQEHVPYGSKPAEEIYGYVVPIFQDLIEQGCEVIVIACNTVTTNLAGRLREYFTVPIVAIEPMVKPAAAMTKTGVIAVCATPATLASPRYQQLKAEFAKGIKIVEPECSDWALMIESQVDENKIRERVEEAIGQNADVIVLGCTHYHWIETEIKQIAAGRAEVIQPEPAIVRRLQEVISELEAKV